MKNNRINVGVVFFSLTISVLVWSMVATAVERPLMQPRVPEGKLAEARALRSPLPDSSEILEKGKGLYHGRAICVNCHGKNGAGDGIGASGLNPSPRDFRHHEFWRHRTEGEIFWVIKHGVPDSGMVGFADVLADDEIWAIIQYERSFAEDRGPRHDKDRERE